MADYPTYRSSPSRLAKVAIAAALLPALAMSLGCTPVMTYGIVTAPNRLNPLAGRVNALWPLQKLLGVDEQFWVPVGPPSARLRVSVRTATGSPAYRAALGTTVTDRMSMLEDSPALIDQPSSCHGSSHSPSHSPNERGDQSALNRYV